MYDQNWVLSSECGKLPRSDHPVNILDGYKETLLKLEQQLTDYYILIWSIWTLYTDHTKWVRQHFHESRYIGLENLIQVLNAQVIEIMDGNTEQVYICT